MDATVLFDRYRLVERAGSGASAEVWRAVDGRTGDEVALKRLHPVVFGSEAGRRRLVREFRAVRSLRHPNIVPVRDLEMSRDEAALILDFVPGTSLRERLASGTPFAAGEAVRISGEVGAALSAAHAAGVVHRDVSPGNVLLGASGEVRLTDFGIAHESADETAVTATGTVVGTLGYLAPELLRGEPATPASDLFGLAAITYEMLAGAPPFRATTPVGLVEAHRSPAAPVAGVDASLDQAVRAGLAPNPADRPTSVAAFTGGLVAALEGDRTEAVGMPVVAPVPVAAAPIAVNANHGDPPVAGSRLDRSRRARPRAGSVAAAAALAIGALVLAAAMTDPRSGNPGPSAAPASVAPGEVTAAPAEPAAAPAGQPVAPAGDDGEEKPDKDDDKGTGGDDKGKGNDKGGGDREDDNKGEG